VASMPSAVKAVTLRLVAVVASIDAIGAAGAQVYLDLVSSYNAPAIGR
jgi:hypothetical protein